MSHLSYMCFPSAQRSIIDCPTPCIAVFAKGMVYRHVGQSVAKHLMEVVSAWRRELVHVRTAETNNINDSKHESCPTGSFYPVFVITLHTHSICQISQIRIHIIPSSPTPCIAVFTLFHYKQT